MMNNFTLKSLLVITCLFFFTVQGFNQVVQTIEKDSVVRRIWGVNLNLSDQLYLFAAAKSNEKLSYTFEPIVSYVNKSNILFRTNIGYTSVENKWELPLFNDATKSQKFQYQSQGGFIKCAMLLPFRKKQRFFDFRYGFGLGYSRFNTRFDVTIPGTNWGDYTERITLNGRQLFFFEPQFDVAFPVVEKFGLVLNVKIPVILQYSQRFGYDQYFIGNGWSAGGRNWILYGSQLLDIQLGYSF